MALRKRYVIPGCLLVLLAAALAAFLLLPWKHVAEERLKAFLQSQGLKNVQLTVAGINFSNILLKDISIGADHPLVLKDLKLGYSLQDLWAGKIRDITLSHLTLEARQDKEVWSIAGRQGLSASGSEKPSAASIPVSLNELASVPDQAKLEDSALHITTTEWQLEMPLDMEWKKLPAPALEAKTSNLHFKNAALEMTGGASQLQATLDPEQKKWSGTWQMKDVAFKGGDMPPLTGDGKITAEATQLIMEGTFKSADNATRLSFNLDYALNAPEKTRLTLVSATMPWHEGTLGLDKTDIPLAAGKDIRLNLQVNKVSVDALMQLMTGNKANGTGTVSGLLPVTLKADGTMLIQAGKLQSEGPGTVTMQPEAIPGDNEQVVMLRDVLKNLHYQLLSVSADSAKPYELSVVLALEGNNPDAYEGRPVKLNVHLTGDVLNFVQQSLMPLLNPRLLLQQAQPPAK